MPRCIAVAPFENLSLTSFGGIAVSELLAQELERTRQFVVLEPGAYQHLTQNLNVIGAASADKNALAALKTELGLDGIVIGTVSEYWYTDDPEVYRDKQPSVTFSARMLDTSDGRMVWTATMSKTPGSGRSHLALLSSAGSDVAAELAQMLSEHFTPETSYRFNVSPQQSACKFEELMVAGKVPGQKQPPPRAAMRDSEPASRGDTAAPPASLSQEPRELSEAAKALVERLKRGEPFVLRGVTFQPDSNALAPESDGVLATVGEIARSYPDLVVAIISHTDNMGEPADLEAQSLKQAETVRDVLIQKHGVAAAQLLVKGRGGAEPLLPNINRRNRQINRRVELQLATAPGGGW